MAQAFFLLKFDYDVAVAKSKAQLAAKDAEIAAEKRLQKRTMTTILVTAIITGLLYWLGSLTE